MRKKELAHYKSLLSIIIFYLVTRAISLASQEASGWEYRIEKNTPVAVTSGTTGLKVASYTRDFFLEDETFTFIAYLAGSADKLQLAIKMIDETNGDVIYDWDGDTFIDTDNDGKILVPGGMINTEVHDIDKTFTLTAFDKICYLTFLSENNEIVQYTFTEFGIKDDPIVIHSKEQSCNPIFKGAHCYTIPDLIDKGSTVDNEIIYNQVKQGNQLLFYHSIYFSFTTNNNSSIALVHLDIQLDSGDVIPRGYHKESGVANTKFYRPLIHSIAAGISSQAGTITMLTYLRSGNNNLAGAGDLLVSSFDQSYNDRWFDTNSGSNYITIDRNVPVPANRESYTIDVAKTESDPPMPVQFSDTLISIIYKTENPASNSHILKATALNYDGAPINSKPLTIDSKNTEFSGLYSVIARQIVVRRAMEVVTVFGSGENVYLQTILIDNYQGKKVKLRLENPLKINASDNNGYFKLGAYLTPSSTSGTTSRGTPIIWESIENNKYYLNACWFDIENLDLKWTNKKISIKPDEIRNLAMTSSTAVNGETIETKILTFFSSSSVIYSTMFDPEGNHGGAINPPVNPTLTEVYEQEIANPFGISFEFEYKNGTTPISTIDHFRIERDPDGDNEPLGEWEEIGRVIPPSTKFTYIYDPIGQNYSEDDELALRATAVREVGGGQVVENRSVGAQATLNKLFPPDIEINLQKNTDIISSSEGTFQVFIKITNYSQIASALIVEKEIGGEKTEVYNGPIVKEITDSEVNEGEFIIYKAFVKGGERASVKRTQELLISESSLPGNKKSPMNPKIEEGSGGGVGGSGGGVINCYIATASFGNQHSPGFKSIYSFRNISLVHNSIGKISCTTYNNTAAIAGNILAQQNLNIVIPKVLNRTFTPSSTTIIMLLVVFIILPAIKRSCSNI